MTIYPRIIIKFQSVYIILGAILKSRHGKLVEAYIEDYILRIGMLEQIKEDPIRQLIHQFTNLAGTL